MTKVRNIRLLKGFGKHLRNLRKEKGFSQEELAYMADVPISQIGRIERGEINPSLSSLYALSSALEISLPRLTDFSIKDD